MTAVNMDELLDALAPSTIRMKAMLDSNEYTEDEKRAKVHSAFIQAVTAGQMELLEWLLDTHARHGRIAADNTDTYAASSHDTEEEEGSTRLDINAKDDNGTPALVLAAVFGHGEVVRLLLEYGADIDSADSRGWTALFWAFERGDLPLSSFLINRKAKASIRSNTGLAATDLIRKGSMGEVLGKILRDGDSSQDSAAVSDVSMQNAATNADDKLENTCTKDETRLRRSSSMSIMDETPSSLPPAGPSEPLCEHTSPRPPLSSTVRTQSISIQSDSQHRAFLDLAAESCRTLDIDYALLDLEEDQGKTQINDFSRNYKPESPDENQGHDNRDEVGNDGESSLMSIFDWEECLNTQMLSFSMEELPALLDLAMEIKPSRSEEARNFPANVIFLASRFASRYGGEDLLGELLLGAIDRIEASINTFPENLANSAFWLSNCILLLYYLRKDPHTQQTTLEYQDNIYDTIGRIFVYCIRDVEKRLDKVLDAAMLDHEALSGYSDIRFEGEWRFVKALTNRSKKDSPFASITGSPSSRPSVLGLFGSPDRSAQQGSPQHTPSHKDTLQEPASTGRIRAPLMPAVLRASMFSSQPTPSQQPIIQPQEEPSPKLVTTILSSTLFILQSYDYAGHPAIIVQAFSQLLYWIASELFNRILTRKRYLCRSKAVQIRLNISALEEWARTHKLPLLMVQAHFRPLNELLQWLQCLSSETSIDGLLTTMQNLQSLNPAQLQKAVKDYRHEVEETKIAEECTQYLSQLQKDWERRRMLQGLDAAKELARVSSSSSSVGSIDSQRTGTSISLRSNESSRTSDMRSDAERHIDDVFGNPLACIFDSFVPTVRRENVSELLEPRLTVGVKPFFGSSPLKGTLLSMLSQLPFSLPTANESLLISQRTYFGNYSHSLTRNTDVIASDARNVYRDFYARPMNGSDPEPYLPEDFLNQLAEAQKPYEGLVPSRRDPALQESKRRRSNIMAMPGTSQHRIQGDHWLNWRERLAIELEDYSVDNET